MCIRDSTYTGLLDYAGPVQSVLREQFHWSRQDYWFPEIRSLPGAVVMLALVLYPYVYLLARAAFLDQSVAVLEVSRTLGAGPWRRFVAVSLPMARPALIAGVSLVQMEALADYGTVQYFGVGTFTTGISVSYTHLDVYKRQLDNSEPASSARRPLFRDRARAGYGQRN